MSDKYPEHEKMKARKEEADALAPFLEWLQDQGYEICDWNDGRDEWHQAFSSSNQIEETMAAFFDIDLKKLAAEKDAMLAEIRMAHQRDETVALRKELTR